MSQLSELRQIFRHQRHLNEHHIVEQLKQDVNFSNKFSNAVQQRTFDWVQTFRTDSKAGLMERFLAERGLNTDDGLPLCV